MAGSFAGGDHRAVERVEAARVAAHRFRQRVAFQHFAAHAGNQGFQLRFLTLLGHRVERFFQRDGGGDQRRQLAGDEGEIAGAGAADKARLSAAAGCRGDVQRQPALFPQQLASVAGGVRLLDAAPGFTVFINGLIAKKRHVRRPPRSAVR